MLNKESRAASAPLPVEERRVTAWVGKSVVFTGALSGSEDMTIDGHVEGTIDLGAHDLTVGASAEIRADIVARSVTIHGAVTGNIRASGKVHIGQTAQFEGDVTTARIAIAEGAFIQGRIDTAASERDDTKRRPELAIA
jgi:cytoskeletal protein CcmA (bactofilin family)